MSLAVRRRDRALLILLPLALASIVGTSLLQSLAERTLRRIEPARSWADRFRAKAATAHLWFEEGVAGDTSISVDRDVLTAIDDARSEIAQLRENRFSPRTAGEMVALLAELDRHLSAWRMLSVERWAQRDAAGAIGQPLDESYDALFDTILDTAARIERVLAFEIEAQNELVTRVRYAQIALNLLVFASIYHLLVRLRAAATLEAETEARSRFLATMSHEIRTPLNAIIGITDVLARAPLPREQRDLLATIQGAGSQLTAIVNDVLDYSKIEAGGLVLEQVPFALRDSVAGTAEMFAPAAAQKDIDLILDLDPALPAAVVGDEVRLRQVLTNLLSNAIKFTPRGSVTLSVRAAPRGVDDVELSFSVRDTGIGMSDATRARLFQPFRQGDASTTRRFGGTGLGLTIAHKIALAMGSGIDVVSAEGAGSTFSFRLTAPRAELPLRSEAKQVLAPRVRELRILVVDDSPMNRAVARTMLTACGYPVTLAESGPEALEQLAHTHHDVVLMDVQMPGMDGLEATRALRARLPAAEQPYVIALTASALAGDREKCLAAGMDDYLSKPLQLEMLERALARSTPRAPAATVVDVGERDETRARLALLPEDARAEVVSLFLSESAARAAEIDHALEARDLAAVQSAAHRLRGNLVVLGAARAAALVGAVDDAARDAALELATTRWREADAAVQAARAAVATAT
jgi:signal transduction histidine kinase/CheY-like chemotaxis protein